MRPQATGTCLGRGSFQTSRRNSPDGRSLGLSGISYSGFVYAGCADLDRGSGHVLVLEATGFAPAEENHTDPWTQRAVPGDATN